MLVLIEIAPIQKLYRFKVLLRLFNLYFDRTPYLCSFQWNNHKLIFITVHSFLGSEKKRILKRRLLEAYAILRYAELV